MKKTLAALTIFASLYLAGCASVPMAPAENDQAKKEFTAPPEGMSGLYIYRNSSFGGALKKTIRIDGKIIGETAPHTYFYTALKPGMHDLATESEFSDNTLSIDFQPGTNYYVQNYIKFGAFVGGAGLKQVGEEEGKKGVLECKLAKDSFAVSASE
jgi:hypothetical protein